MTTKNFDIEVLRATAIIGTLASHLDILFFWGNSNLAALQKVFFMWGGVDLFFCISGYVITGNLLRILPPDRRMGFSSFAVPFWIRRAWRIVPSAWLWLAIPLVLSVVANRTGYLGTPIGNAIDSLSAVAQVANFHFWSCYAIPKTTCGVDQVYWSLSLEEQSYILLPILLYFASRRTVVVILSIVILVQLFLPRPILSFFWFVRTDALALGALLAILKQGNFLDSLNPSYLSNRLVSRICFSALCILIAAIPGAGSDIPFHTGMVALVSAAMVWIASYDNNYVLPNGLLKNVLIYIGSRSYAIYLIHVPMYRVTREIWVWTEGASMVIDGRYSLRFALTAMILTFTFAELNFRFIESPLRKYGARLADRWNAKRVSRMATASS
ncbi:acyltransferase family protein [Burkholderia thailandensis MSMB59]|uniref:acyltransferase family protein n=1 Tax=Burkholderia thailandensis TaxID=57975 RepID=UPI0005154D79|nr:acyltransferase [Burkholderia thailandensis]AIS95852.1 acyltransferase family protein [Burkholderia thailandensis MSMB59]